MRLPIVLALLAGALAGAEPTLVVHAVDARTGAAVEPATCLLARPGERAVRARFAGSRYEGGVTPAAGDALYVYARGYDLAAVACSAPGAVDVALEPASTSCTLLFPADGDPPPFELVRMVRAAEAWLHDHLRDAHAETLRARRVTVPLGRGLVVGLSVSAPRHLIWPGSIDARPGTVHELYVERPRVVALQAPEGVQAVALEAIPDFAWQPAVAPARIDAWKAHVARPGWLRHEIAAGGDALEVVPDVPFHLFGRAGGAPFYRRVDRGTDALDLSPRPLRRLARPEVDGRPAPVDAVVVPGRLDLYAAATVADLAGHLPGCAHVVGRGDWPEVFLPAADWLTVWDRERGVAHLRWTAGVVPRGARHGGAVVMHVPPGYAAAGELALYPIWKGTGAVRTEPPLNGLAHRFDGAAPVRVAGLPPGWYGLSVRVTLTDAAGGAGREVARTWEIEVSADERSFSLPLR